MALRVMAQVKNGVWLRRETGREIRLERLLAPRIAFAAWMCRAVMGLRYCSGRVHWVFSWMEVNTRLDLGRWR